MFRLNATPDPLARLHGPSTFLLLLDYQHGTVTSADGETVEQAAALCRTAGRLGIARRAMTLGAPEGRRGLVDEIAGLLTAEEVLFRSQPDAWQSPELQQELRRRAISRVLIAGTGADVAVSHTVRSLLREGFTVQVAWDACAAPSELARQVAFHRLTQAGAIPATVADVLTELSGGEVDLAAANRPELARSA